jgi:hypothetical protein
MLPPLGKMAVVYRTALEHQKSPYATFWYYLHGSFEKYQNNSELSKVLMAEAFANNTFLKYGKNPGLPGNDDSVSWWNQFLNENEDNFSKDEMVADVGIFFSPDNQLAYVPPGHFTLNQDYQPHMFSHWGFATAMIDSHIPYKVITDWKLNKEALSGLRTFVLPNVDCLDDSVLEILEEWVLAGGRLVMTGAAGTRKGTKGFFARRNKSLLDSLVSDDVSISSSQKETVKGEISIFVADATDIQTIDDGDDDQEVKNDVEESTEIVYHNQYGQGEVFWTAADVGIDYFLNDDKRAVNSEKIVELIGESVLFDGQQLSTEVGSYCWQSTDEQTLFVDLVNYNLELEEDRIEPISNLSFKIKMPANKDSLKVSTISPDDIKPATYDVNGQWLKVNLAELNHFASVKIEL